MLFRSNKCIRQDSTQAITWTGHPESRFTFDLVADENVGQVSLTDYYIAVKSFVLFFFLV